MTEPNTPAPEQILVGLRAAIAECLDGVDLARFDLNTVHPGTPMLSLPIDSLALMQIIGSVEDRFRVYIPEEMAYGFATVGELVDFVHHRTVAKAAKWRG